MRAQALGLGLLLGCSDFRVGPLRADAAADRPPTDPCAALRGCEACVQSPACGWCKDLARCTAGGAQGPTDRACTSAVWARSVDACVSAARCGDSQCTAGETCGNCAADCGRCPNPPCAACSGGRPCGPGQTCTARGCDGVQGCYVTGDPGALCEQIDGVRCPRASGYYPCVADADCGPEALCRSAYSDDAAAVCRRRCRSNADCIAPGGDPEPVCSPPSGLCFLRCNVGVTRCPGGLSCAPFSAGSPTGYCAPR